MGGDSPRLEPATIAERLVAEFKYSPASADSAARDLVACGDVVWGAFMNWWRTGDIGVLEVQGFSAEELVGKHALLAPGAFLMLDWLSRDPKAAKLALARQHDAVGRRPTRSR